MVLERPEAKLIARNRQRTLANDLIDALRARHDGSRIVPVVEEAEDESPKLGKSKALFRVIGAHRGSKWQRADYTALVVSGSYLEADGTGYQIMLPDFAFEQVRQQVKQKGWACGSEHFQQGRHEPRGYACEFCELLYKRNVVYRPQNGELRRNSEVVTQAQAAIADLLLQASSLVPIVFSSN